MTFTSSLFDEDCIVFIIIKQIISFLISVTDYGPPEITEDPQSVTKREGEDVTLSFDASGNPKIHQAEATSFCLFHELPNNLSIILDRW